LFLNNTGTYAGTGLLYMNIGGTAGNGTGIAISANGTYVGAYLDLRRGGSSQFSIDPTNGVVTGLQVQLSGNFSQTGATTFSTGTGAVTLNGPVTVSGTNTFATGTGNISLNGSIVTNVIQTGAVNFSTGTGTVTLNGNTSVVSGKTVSVGGGTAIKSIELGTCTQSGFATTTCSAASGSTTGINFTNTTVTDSITISAENNVGATAGRVCHVDTITAGPTGSFRINCTANPGTGLIWNVLVIRR